MKKSSNIRFSKFRAISKKGMNKVTGGVHAWNFENSKSNTGNVTAPDTTTTNG